MKKGYPGQTLEIPFFPCILMQDFFYYSDILPFNVNGSFEHKKM